MSLQALDRRRRLRQAAAVAFRPALSSTTAPLSPARSCRANALTVQGVLEDSDPQRPPASRRASPSPGAPTPACTPAARSRRSSPRARLDAADAAARAQRLAAGGRRRARAVADVAPDFDPRRDARAAALPLPHRQPRRAAGARPRAGLACRRRPWTSRRWRRRRAASSACTTSRPSPRRWRTRRQHGAGAVLLRRCSRRGDVVTLRR